MSHRFEGIRNTYAMGDEDVAARLDDVFNLFDFLTRSEVYEAPADGYRLILKTYRGFVAVKDDGSINTAELTIIKNPVAFRTDRDYRASILKTTRWNNAGSFINDVVPLTNTTKDPTMLDRDGATLQNSMRDQIRLLGSLLSREMSETEVPQMVFRHGMDSDFGAIGAARFNDAVTARLETILKDTIVPEYMSCLEQVRHHLDVPTQDAMTLSGINEVSSYNWIAGSSQEAEAYPHLKQDRLQAVTSYPMLWPFFQQPFSAYDEAIRKRSALSAVIGRELELSKHNLAALQGLTNDDFGLSSAPSKAYFKTHVLPVIRSIPVGPQPKGSAEWSTARALMEASVTIDSMTPGSLGTDLLQRFGNKWGSIEPQAAEQMTGGLRDMVNFMHRYIWQPATAIYTSQTHNNPKWRQSDTARIMFSNMNLSRLAEASHRWHETYERISEVLAANFPPFSERAISLEDENSWDVLHKGPNLYTATNGCTLTFLTTTDALKEEGTAMNHCVGGYTQSCRLGNKHIFSIRDVDGKRIATGEILLPVFNKNIIRGGVEDAPLNTLPDGIIQLRGFKNSVPPITAYTAVWDYVRAVAVGAIRIDVAGLLQKTEDRRVDIKNGFTPPPYNYEAPGAIEEAWKHLSFMMGKSTAKAGPFTTFDEHLLKMNEQVERRVQDALNPSL